MKIYVISGLGADYKVLERLVFPEQHQVIAIDWIVPVRDEKFANYVKRMAEKVDDSEPFYLLGYSFGGIMVQEINRLKPAVKTVILGSIKSDKEKSRLIKIGQYTRIPQFLPVGLFNIKTLETYAVFRKFFDPKNPKINQYFRFTDPYYLKWSVQRIAEWKFEQKDNVIQIMGDRDIVFPFKNSKPDYIIKGGTHLFPATKHKEVSQLLKKIFI
ncbi:hypothetical protein ASG31_15845 [Chryseobacterium sp. Leaf404]|uniref:alpha/beta hydrolase n=1 Tax=unclassified Chryseobacterium TaxID=2593645 RepID=UPI0006FEE371|nr:MULTISPECIES: alpha/beta hydrolase [unclassified Chryseobacterium]KQT15072.1 hypothetical protein ASG31_15845 [Chryseobacterium sp. Leaf404]